MNKKGTRKTASGCKNRNADQRPPTKKAECPAVKEAREITAEHLRYHIKMMKGK